MKNIFKKIFICIICAIIFFLVTMPFRRFFMLVSTTEVRPASALPPVCGLLFGLLGAIGCAIGNLVADIVSGYNFKIIIPSFFIQVIYGYLPYILWYGVRKSKSSPIAFDTVFNVIKFVIIMIINSAICAIALGICIELFDGGKLFSNMTLIIFFNNFDFSLLLGMPLINLSRLISFDIDKRKSPKINHNLSLNEKMITNFMITGVVLSAFMATMGYFSLLKSNNMEWVKIWNRIYIYMAIILNIFFCGVILFLRYIEKNITVPIKSISDVAANYVIHNEENLSSSNALKECSEFEKDKTEIGVMARSMKKMILDLDVYMSNIKKNTAERERIAVELNIATKIQEGLLPKECEEISNSELIDLYGTMATAKEVGGDFYDFFKLDNDHIAVAIGDVSGKGIPAAMFMAVTKILIQLYIKEGKTLAETFTIVNSKLCEGNEANMFVTAFAGILELSSGKFTYVNAGHNAPLIKRENEEFKYLKLKPGFVLAGIETFKYKEFEMQLNKGDILFLYTDGVTEAINSKNELFGEKRLKKVLDETSSKNLNYMVENIKDNIDYFSEGLEQFDDITMLALKVNK